MNNIYSVVVPNIGDVKKAKVIDILVSIGDFVEKDQGLITLESDKSVIEIPSDVSGKILNININIGDEISSGVAILEMDIKDQMVSNDADKMVPNDAKIECQVVVIGSGPGGYSAAFRAADLGLDTVLIEKHSSLGGVCLNVGCIPTKSLLYHTSIIDRVKKSSCFGISYKEDPEINLDVLRKANKSIVSKLTNGLSSMAKLRKVKVIKGVANFIDKNNISVKSDNSDLEQIIHFENAIVATGSHSVKLPFLPDDKRIVDSTGALELPTIPKKMLIIGGGIISLEMGTIYSSLGANIDIVELSDGLVSGADRDLIQMWHKNNEQRFNNIMLETRVVSAESRNDGIYVNFEGKNSPNIPQNYDLILQAVGRKPNIKNLGLEKIGVLISDDGFIAVDKQMRTNVANIFAIGDVNGNPMLAHKAVHEAHVASEVISGKKTFFDALVIPSVAYTNPEIAWVGITEDEARDKNIKIKKGIFPWLASGKAIATDSENGFTKLLFDLDSKRIIGGGIVGSHAGDLISEIALAIEMGADMVDISKTIHPHPTLSESIGMSSEAAIGICTDLPPNLL
ncbi:dihydrolipoamide dehydrogenase [Candidatus Kinetoplastibacterium desouzaii TCC079E]|uniref:Dihydrolipoyl dehydrogenase n=1 Tax=Candidatus Kinetoplastidibacterium desouzai TCC079E TaxID=1208919 RepID=M1LMA8_9PROT|nr:dihydrolipoyl dehydrogenase [Candidatus Kinetoplastibacterium desouzaii]AGF46857.1 dihydrolipoamide dehydrogenase [Candidatus Kinetoplastibacterium desouzaii TCC079E]